MERRALGRTGEKLSAVAFGGIVVAGMEQKDADAIVGEAIDVDINYFDVAPSYDDAEERLGPAMVGKRDGLFLACKTTERSAEGARREMEQSLRNLRTDRFDLYQAHAVSNMDDVEEFFGPGGAMEAFLKMREEGKTRYIGFSAHSDEAAVAMMEHFDFDTVLFPTNYVCWFEGGFGPSIAEAAKERNMGLLALKAMARQKWPEGGRGDRYRKCWYQPEDDEYYARLGLRFAWTQGITACVPPGDPDLWRMGVRLAQQGTQPLSDDETNELRARATGLTPIFSTAVMA